jgi:hypothetical protein
MRLGVEALPGVWHGFCSTIQYQALRTQVAKSEADGYPSQLFAGPYRVACRSSAQRVRLGSDF